MISVPSTANPDYLSGTFKLGNGQRSSVTRSCIDLFEGNLGGTKVYLRYLLLMAGKNKNGSFAAAT